jgi:hypothetical protein
MALVILDDEVVPLERRGETCVCGARATLKAYLKDRPETGHFCAHCVLYSGRTQWGYDNRAEILDVGRAAQEMAGKHGKPMPAVDERGRLLPEDANRFMLGVVFTTKMLSRIARVMPPQEKPS